MVCRPCAKAAGRRTSLSSNGCKGTIVSAATAITNLLYLYAERIDAGDFEGAAALFTGARVKLAGGQEIDGADLVGQWRDWVRVYPCGTPRTKHVVTNAIVEVDEAAGTATSRSYYTVFQQTEILPLQPICTGRYHDSFVREDGRWRFATRDYSLIDYVGDLSQHLKLSVPAQEN
ncbi:MAG: nuclear transport factor 2 family protein [Sphingomonadales bacterium]|nr:nuclear transport factor 2 family protein [Sphingomonadales bacterium]